MEKLLKIEDLANILGISKKSVQNLSAASLPPAIILPGKHKARRWRESDVVRWLSTLHVTEKITEESPPVTSRRGPKRRAAL